MRVQDLGSRWEEGGGARKDNYKDGQTARGRVTVSAQLSHLTGLSRWSAPLSQVCGTLLLNTAQSPPFTGVKGFFFFFIYQIGVTETSCVCQISGREKKKPDTSLGYLDILAFCFVFYFASPKTIKRGNVLLRFTWIVKVWIRGSSQQKVNFYPRT